MSREKLDWPPTDKNGGKRTVASKRILQRFKTEPTANISVEPIKTVENVPEV